LYQNLIETQEVEARGLPVQGQPGSNAILSQKQNKEMNKETKKQK
jgi:hypothetical protein